MFVERRRHRNSDPWTYEKLDLRQREIARSIVEKEDPGAILLSELAPVITLGKRTPLSDLVLPASRYEQLGISVHRTDRGGLATYHGPGQWVLFVVDRLERLTGDSRGVRKAVMLLLQIAQKVGTDLGFQPEIREGAELGVWIPDGKFAAVGVHVENRVLLHGLAINGRKTAQSFQGLRPCGLDAPVGFLLPEQASDSDFEDLGHRIERAVRETIVPRSGEV